jgi:hypothetical protein
MRVWLVLGLLSSAAVAQAEQQVDLGCEHLRIKLARPLGAEVVEQDWGRGRPHSEARAKLELISCAGKVLDQLELDAPLARLDPEPLHGAPHPTYLVSADLTAEAGSYNGPVTVPVQVVRDRLQVASARDRDGRTSPIRLSTTGKSAWKRKPGPHGEELLSVHCQPQGDGFTTRYDRYMVVRKSWVVRSRIRKAMWESDSDFPDAAFFPSKLSSTISQP